MSNKTVRELSEKWGISRQAIQKRIKKLPVDNQPKKVDGRYVLTPETVSLLEAMDSVDSQQPALKNDSQVETTKSKPSINEEEKSVVSLDESRPNQQVVKDDNSQRFIDELIKDKEQLHHIINSLEERLKDNQNLLSQQQKLTLQSNHQIDQLQKQLSDTVELTDEQLEEIVTDTDSKESIKEDITTQQPEQPEEVVGLQQEVNELSKESGKGFWARLFNK